MSFVLRRHLVILMLALAAPEVFSGVRPQPVALRVFVDTSVRIEAFREPFSVRFGNGDSLARYVLARFTEELDPRYRMAGDSASDTVDWDIRLDATVTSHRTDYHGSGGGIQLLPAILFRVNARRVGAVDGEGASVEITGSGNEFGQYHRSLGVAVDRAVDALNQRLDGLLASSLLAESRAQPKPPRYLIYEEPLKYALWLGEIPTWRVSLARQDGKKLYIAKVSGFYSPHEIRERGGVEIERPHRLWLRAGGGLRRLSNARGGGPFWEGDVNLVIWEFREEIDRFSYTGLQFYNYVGHNYVGERMFFTAGVGAGLNVGATSEKNSTNADNPLAPGFIRHPPFSPFGSGLSFDVELALGVFF